MPESGEPRDSFFDHFDNRSSSQQIRYYGERIRLDSRRIPFLPLDLYVVSPNWRDFIILDLASSVFPERQPNTTTFNAVVQSSRHRPDDVLEDRYVSIPPEDRYRVKLRIRNVVAGEPRVVESEEFVDEQ